MLQLLRSTMTWFMHLDREEWVIVLAIGTVVGGYCMRGFGSRANY